MKNNSWRIAPRRRRYWPSVACVLTGVWLLAAALYFSGCSSTVTPEAVAAREAGWGDNGQQNSGFLQFVTGGALIDESARARYNALIELYGDSFLPALKKDQGLRRARGAWFISYASLQDLDQMVQWHRMRRDLPRAKSP
jgi:hypothetical protein